jgi:hypothetical protein
MSIGLVIQVLQYCFGPSYIWPTYWPPVYAKENSTQLLAIQTISVHGV